MTKTIRNLALFGGTIILLSFVVFVVNQTAQVVQLASTFDPAAGKLVLIGLIAVYAVLVAVPVVMVIRLPRPLEPPASETDPEYTAHLHRLRGRLQRQQAPRLEELEDEAAIERAIERLDDEAVRIVKRRPARSSSRRRSPRAAGSTPSSFSRCRRG